MNGEGQVVPSEDPSSEEMMHTAGANNSSSTKKYIPPHQKIEINERALRA